MFRILTLRVGRRFPVHYRCGFSTDTADPVTNTGFNDVLKILDKATTESPGIKSSMTPLNWPNVNLQSSRVDVEYPLQTESVNSNSTLFDANLSPEPSRTFQSQTMTELLDQEFSTLGSTLSNSPASEVLELQKKVNFAKSWHWPGAGSASHVDLDDTTPNNNDNAGKLGNVQAITVLEKVEFPDLHQRSLSQVLAKTFDLEAKGYDGIIPVNSSDITVGEKIMEEQAVRDETLPISSSSDYPDKLCLSALELHLVDIKLLFGLCYNYNVVPAHKTRYSMEKALLKVIKSRWSKEGKRTMILAEETTSLENLFTVMARKPASAPVEDTEWSLSLDSRLKELIDRVKQAQITLNNQIEEHLGNLRTPSNEEYDTIVSKDRDANFWQVVARLLSNQSPSACKRRGRILSLIN